MIDFKLDDELSELVQGYVVTRDDAGCEPPEGDFTESGLTDFPYVCDDMTGVEMMIVGARVFEASGGKEIWYTHDGVGIRYFFGPIEELRERVRQRMKEIPIQAILQT